MSFLIRMPHPTFLHAYDFLVLSNLDDTLTVQGS
jgi:hypothetical protein